MKLNNKNGRFMGIIGILVMGFSLMVNAQQTPFERNGKNYTATYQEMIDYYRLLDREYRCIKMIECGQSDAGEPLHLVTFNAQGLHRIEDWGKQENIRILINNGIHPGEPDGIDASMMLLRDLAQKVVRGETGWFDTVSLAVIPVYNIGGCLERSAFHRPDQEGPEEFGERGNSQYLDLNRDFIKCDSREARSFASLFQELNPDIFIDNHVSDGADYQHVMTLATTQAQKLGGVLGTYLLHQFEPALFQGMKNSGYPMIPYVNVWGKDAKEGWNQFFDGPRYSSGYAALFQTFGFTIETHMLKPYPLRVDATYKLMSIIAEYATSHQQEIKKLRLKAKSDCQNVQEFPLSWKLRKDTFQSVELMGYEYKLRPSKVSGLPVHYYDHASPYTEKVKFYNVYEPQVIVAAPKAYIIPQGWWKVIEQLQFHEVEMTRLEEDQMVEVEYYRIQDYKSNDKSYEGHHANYDVIVAKEKGQIHFRKGDYFIPLSQNAKRFLIETLEPQ
ncbi:MAG TPA: hypothetical protein PLU10_00635, partial [Chitinophagaceae bacterium]|nr:hypothetical protein [Chitinophagaceae bacterium]